MKNFFITGGTSGIGYNCVKYIAKDHNNRVLIISSNKEKGRLAVTKLRQLTKNKNINFLQCDLSSIKETNRLIYNNQIFKIDVLINNAGAIYFTKQFSNENIEKTFALNHMGYFSITNFLLKKNLIKNGAKIINVASGAHWGVDLDLNDLQMKVKYNGWLAYKKSKLCNILFTRKLSKLLIQRQISVNCLHPGFVKTDFGKNNFFIFKFFLGLAMKFTAINVDEGTKTLLHLINDKKNNVTGEYFYKEKPSPSSSFSQDMNNAEKLWNESYKLIKMYL